MAPVAENWLIGKDPDAGKGWSLEDKGMTGDKMVEWHNWLNRHGLSKLQDLVKGREAWHAEIYEVTKNKAWLSEWTEPITHPG